MQSRLARRQVWLLISAVIFGSAGGFLAFYFVDKSGYVTFDAAHEILNFSAIRDSLRIFAEQMVFYFREPGFRSLSLLLLPVSFVLLIRIIIRARNEKNDLVLFVSAFILVFNCAVISAPIINGNYTGYDTLRYNIYPFYFSAFVIPFAWNYLLRETVVLKNAAFLPVIFTAVLVIPIVLNLNIGGIKNYLEYYPPMVRQLDSVATQNNLKYGVANYWDAKKATMFSRTGLRVYAVYDDLSAYPHVSNNKWFFGDNIFNFVVLNGFNDTNLYRSVVRESQIIHQSADLQVARTNPFTYIKSSGSAVINIQKQEQL